jgi:hypothetical protein
MTAGFLTRLEHGLRGRYTIERVLGEGGMAVVFLAKDERHDRHVALKVLRPELASEIGSERFLREIKIAAGLTHPHILPLHDSGEVDGFLAPRRSGDGGRLRHWQGGECGGGRDHADRNRRGDTGVHEPRAVDGRGGGGWAERSLQSGVRPLRDVDG